MVSSFFSVDIFLYIHFVSCVIFCIFYVSLAFFIPIRSYTKKENFFYLNRCCIYIKYCSILHWRLISQTCTHASCLDILYDDDCWVYIFLCSLLFLDCAHFYNFKLRKMKKNWIYIFINVVYNTERHEQLMCNKEE